MATINYKSDFDLILRLKDCEGNDVGFPSYDWRAKFYTSSSSRAYTASCTGGTCVNCFDDEGQVHVVFNAHGLSAGRLRVEFYAALPDAMYPDKTRDVCYPQELDVELVTGAGGCTGGLEVEATLPFVYVTAYELAVRGGYEGTLEEYMGYVNRFPQVAEASKAVMGLLSDLSAGKAHVADALTRQGVPTAPGEAMEQMAEKILGLQLAVEGDQAFVPHEHKIGRYDLYNEMHNHRRAAYPYMYAVSFSRRTITLEAADAYLCSDGFFTTEGGEHTFPTDSALNYVIFYFASETFVVRDSTVHLSEIVVLGGIPRFGISNNAYVGVLEVYAEEPYVFTLDTITIRGMVIAMNIATVSGGTVASNCGNLTELSLPLLATVSGGTVASGCGNLTEINLPALTEIVRGAIDINLLYNVNLLNQDLHVRMPKLKRVYSASMLRASSQATHWVYFHLGAIEDGYFAMNVEYKDRVQACVTVEEGFRSYLNISDFQKMTAEQLRDILVKLGDNSEYETLGIVLGAANLAKLTEEDIAIATQKNYSLS